MNKTLQMGENLTLSAFKGTVIVTHDISYSIDISLSAFLLTDMDKVLGQNGIIFYNQPEGPSGVATLISPYDMGNTKNHKIDFDMSKTPEGITKIAVTLSEANATGFSNVKNLRAEIHAGDDVIQLAHSNFTNENGVVVLELYLKNGQAKARAVLRGFVCGLDGLCKIYGIEIADADSQEQSQFTESQITQKQVPQIQAIKPSSIDPMAVKSNIGEETAGVVFSNYNRNIAKSMNLIMKYVTQNEYINHNNLLECTRKCADLTNRSLDFNVLANLSLAVVISKSCSEILLPETNPKRLAELSADFIINNIVIKSEESSVRTALKEITNYENEILQEMNDIEIVREMVAKIIGSEESLKIFKLSNRWNHWIKIEEFLIYDWESNKKVCNKTEKLIVQSGLTHQEKIKIESLSGASVAGTVYGNISNASTIYGMDKFNTPRGHGFAAERANDLYDRLTGQKIIAGVGDDNLPNGADRNVNGVNIQSKYCNSGSKCIQECFQDGRFKYINPDGSPMKIEVPSDKYDAAVQAMENRIKNGEVRGVTDPGEAKNIVRKGNFTYEQARNIAKVGTVESITFDAVNGAIIATTALGVSTALTFATAIWNGADFDVAMRSATYSGLKVGGTTFVTAVLASQLSKAGLNSALVGSSEAIVSIMGPKASAMLANAFRSGTNIYGAAAMKSAAKMLRGNAITGAVSVVVLSSVDVVNIFRGRISGAQLFKNVACTASTVAGGTAGWVGGAAAGAAVGSVVPIIGTAVGGVLGGLLGSFAGGSAASKVSNVVLCEFIEDDVDEMVRIIEKVFTQMAEDYLLNEKEAENIIENLKDDLTSSTLKDMFCSSDRQEFARELLINLVESEVKKRKKVSMPSQEEMQKGLRSVLEEMSDNMAIS